MKFLLVLVLAILVAAAEDVLEFNDDNFKTEIVKHDIILVEFFAPWWAGRARGEWPKAAVGKMAVY